MKLTEKLFGTHSDHELKRINPIVDKIESLRPEMQALSDEELKKRRSEWVQRKPSITTGYLARYASLVTSGNRGAVLEVPSCNTGK